MSRLSSLLEPVQSRDWHLPVKPDKLLNCSMPQFPHPPNSQCILAQPTSQACWKEQIRL